MKGLSSIPLPMIIIVSLATIFMLITLVYYLVTKKKYGKNKNLYTQDAIRVKKHTHKGANLDSFYQSLYLGFVKIPVISYYAKKIRLKFEMTNDYTEYQIRRLTAKNMFIAMVIMFTSIFIMINIVNNLYMSLIVIVGILIVTEKVIDMNINKVSTNILRQMPDAFTAIRHAFHEHGMLEESFDAAIDELNEKDIAPQLKRIKEAMLSENPETELERYYDTAPNRFLKLFAGVSYLTMELGDRKIDGKSVYLRNLNNILGDIYLELLKIDKINYLFRSLNIIAVIPILFVNILRGWAESNFPALINFYSSTTGFIVQALIVVSIFVSYLLLRILKEDNELIKFDRVTAVRWQDKVYKNAIVRELVDSLKPKEHTKKYRKVTKLIKNTNSYLTLEWLYINKITAFIIGAIGMFIFIINLQFINLNSIYNSISQEFMTIGSLDEANKKAAASLNEADRSFVEKNRGKNITKEELKNQMQKDGKTYSDTDVNRVYDKINSVNDVYFKYWHLIIILLTGFIAYQFPTLILFIKNKMREMEKENEIMQFQSIILMLMYIERVDVQTIMEWLARFSYAFKEPISTALNNYEAGAIEALEELKEDVPYKDFTRIVEQLEAAVERIPIREAFDELETEKDYHYQKRKANIEKLITKKITIGKVIGFTPMTILIGGYLIIPLVAVSISQMLQYFEIMR